MKFQWGTLKETDYFKHLRWEAMRMGQHGRLL